MALADADPAERPGRGRPQLHGDDVVLSAALAAFAEVGYEAMSIRSLARDLGLSHGALNQRFGSKDALFRAAVDHGFGDLARGVAAHAARWPAATDREVLRNGVRAFLLASADRPQIVRLMNTLGITRSHRLDDVFERHVRPMVEPLRAAVVAAAPSAQSRTSTRELFFLIAHGAAAAFSLQALSDHFDEADGPLDPEAYADHMAEVLVRILDP